jgi:hypothetical protein
MSGFITTYGGYSGGIDLDSLFAPGDTGANTGFVGDNGVDFGRKYAPIANGSPLGFNVGFVATDGRDLSQWFALTGSVAPNGNWPVGGGFVIGSNGAERFATDTITVLCGRLQWRRANVNGANGDNADGSNLIADRFNLCPGTGAANANSWSDFGGYSRAGIYGLPLNSVLQFDIFTDNLGGQASQSITVGPGYAERNWQAVHTGGIALCENTTPVTDDPQNVFDFSPGANLYYGSQCSSLNWTGPNNWEMKLAAGFAVNRNNGTLNVVRVRVTRVS